MSVPFWVSLIHLFFHNFKRFSPSSCNFHYFSTSYLYQGLHIILKRCCSLYFTEKYLFEGVKLNQDFSRWAQSFGEGCCAVYLYCRTFSSIHWFVPARCQYHCTPFPTVSFKNVQTLPNVPRGYRCPTATQLGPLSLIELALVHIKEYILVYLPELAYLPIIKNYIG